MENKFSTHPSYPSIGYGQGIFVNSEHKGKGNFDDLVNYLENKKGPVLDIACGSGEFISLLLSKNPNIECYGITMSLDEVQYNIKNNRKVLPIDMRDMSSISNIKFESIVIWCSFQYVTPEEQDLVAEQIYNMLTPNGRFYNIYDQPPANWSPKDKKFKEVSLNIRVQGALRVFEKHGV